MASSEVSPRKRPKLSSKGKQKKEEDDIGSNLKTDSTNSQLDIRKKNFIKACLNVSYEAYQDIKKRFQLLYLPACINNSCNHGDRNGNVKEISQSIEQSFKTEMKNNTWYEALEICQVCTTSYQFLSANVLKDIVEIMMNSHEDLDTGYTIDYLLRKCQHTLMAHFNMHPPCVTKSIRDCYKKFLTSRMNDKDLSNRKEYLSDQGIVSHCFSRLKYEISMESKDGILIEEQEVPTDIEGVKRLHWKKENFELFELLVRTERIERCMLVLESLIYLLQTDIALWHARRNGTDSQTRSQRPLLASILWPYSYMSYGTVTSQCKIIIELFAYYIHLQYPERHIKTMGLWMNAVVQMFYMYDLSSGVDYPKPSSFCTIFSREFHKIISPLPYTSISRILEKVQPSIMQYLLGICHIQVLLDCNHSDILYIIISCVNNMSWDKYPIGDKELTYSKKRLKPHKLLDYLYRKCRSLNVSTDVRKDSYPKLELTKNDSKICQDYIIHTLFTTVVAYLEMHCIKNFNQTLEYYNENEYNCYPTSYASYSVTDEFVKHYRSIVKSLQELFIILKDKQDHEPLKKLSDLLDDYFCN